MFNKITQKVKTVFKNLAQSVSRKTNQFRAAVGGSHAGTLIADRSGEAGTSILITILIIVILGAAVLLILKNAMPEVWNNIMDKITSLFT